MRKPRRLLTGVVAASMSLAMVACGDDTPEVDDDATVTTESELDVPTTEMTDNTEMTDTTEMTEETTDTTG